MQATGFWRLLMLLPQLNFVIPIGDRGLIVHQVFFVLPNLWRFLSPRAVQCLRRLRAFLLPLVFHSACTHGGHSSFGSNRRSVSCRFMVHINHGAYLSMGPDMLHLFASTVQETSIDVRAQSPKLPLSLFVYTLRITGAIDHTHVFV